MCQLILASMHSDDKMLGKLFLLTAMLEDSRTTNQDGFGMLGLGNLVKTAIPASSCTNIGSILKQMKVGTYVSGHVRQASMIAGKKLEVSDEMAQPFNGNRYVLMHNGTLEYRNKKVIEDSDSLTFLRELEERKEEEFVERFNATMALFHGKFAMIIKDKVGGDIYICRGGAELHMGGIREKGGEQLLLGVNTVKLDLERILQHTTSYYNLVVDDQKELEVMPVSILARETIFKLNGFQLEEIGKCEETHSPVVTSITPTTSFSSRNYYGGYDRDEGWSSYTGKPKYNPHPLGKQFVDFLNENDVEPIFLDHLSMMEYGVPFLSMTGEQINQLATRLRLLTWYNNKGKKKIWNKLTRFATEDYLYEKLGLHYPYFLNTISELEAAEKNLKKLTGM